MCVSVSQSVKEESLRKQEVFTVGMKHFPWVSFPSLCSYEQTQSQLDRSQKGLGQADEPKSLSSTAEKTHCVTATDQAKNTAREDTKGISELDLSPQSGKRTQLPGCSAQHLALSQSSAKAFSFQQHCRGTAQNSRENRKESNRKEHPIQTHQGSIAVGEARCAPAEEKLPFVSVPESCREKTENQSEGSSALDSCPMCLIRFSGT